MSGRATEHADAVVVGARCAGSAVAIALARAGRRVVALDRVSFPADTISTHLLFPSGVVELARLGALERVRALGAPPLRRALVAGAGMSPSAAFSVADGIGWAMCVRRTGLDAALVDTAREAGADVREGVRVKGLVWRDGRVTGVRALDAEDREIELRAPLVVGADGRRSTVARLVGVDDPYRSNANGRACYYAYFRDGEPAWRSIAAQWREGPELATAFPCDDGLVLVLLMPPVTRIEDFRRDVNGEFDRTVSWLPGLRARLEHSERVTKVRSATDTTSYFRRSCGPGWALPGDAGHFKDPVTAQGIRDALRFGRLLGEAVAPALGDPRQLDAALLAWERRRERECLETYQWTNELGRGEAMTPLEVELYRALEADAALTRRLLDVFSRRRSPSRALGPVLGARLAVRSVARGREGGRRVALEAVAREVRTAARNRLERELARRRPLPPLPAPPRDPDSSRRTTAAPSRPFAGARQ